MDIGQRNQVKNQISNKKLASFQKVNAKNIWNFLYVGWPNPQKYFKKIQFSFGEGGGVTRGKIEVSENA